ncbi:MAG: tRNA uracil 4-sulfurtransferase ThiI [Candidatus Nanoarchaeia archaeon]
MLLVRYAEIGLKGKNRHIFESTLIQNIKAKLGNVQIKKELCSILIEGCDAKASLLKEIFGIAWFANVEILPLDIAVLTSKTIQILTEKNPKTFKIEINRANKKFPLTSIELARQIGSACEAKGFKFSAKDPELKIFIDILNESALIYTEKINGLGGLPVGVSGKILCLLSGGIDSPVAAWLIAKRGAKVDFLHFYSVRSLDEIKNSKILELFEQLKKYTQTSKLWLVPIWDFQLATLDLQNYELQLFRRFMLKVAESIAKSQNYDAIVLGDSLGQVASQTISNLKTIDRGINITIFRPLIGLDKKEIVELAKRIGTYELSIKPYHDCCALVAKKPKTKIDFKTLEQLENKIKLSQIVNTSVEKANCIS